MKNMESKIRKNAFMLIRIVFILFIILFVGITALIFLFGNILSNNYFYLLGFRFCSCGVTG